jgi:divalent metal cation (Fe/Co/Zn/Cd) transporter
LLLIDWRRGKKLISKFSVVDCYQAKKDLCLTSANFVGVAAIFVVSWFDKFASFAEKGLMNNKKRDKEPSSPGE